MFARTERLPFSPPAYRFESVIVHERSNSVAIASPYVNSSPQRGETFIDNVALP